MIHPSDGVCIGGQASTNSLQTMDSTVNVELNLHDLESVVGGVIHELTMDPQWAAKVEGERFEIADLWAEYASGNWIERARKVQLVPAAQRDQHDQRQNITSGATSESGLATASEALASALTPNV